MPLFRYSARELKTGKLIKGEIEGETERLVRQALKNKGLLVVEIGQFDKFQPAKGEIKFSLLDRVSYGDLAILTRQLATLLDSGFQLVFALNKLSAVTGNSKLRAALVDIRERVERGVRFSVALSFHKKIFPDFYINMVASGEHAGNLEYVLDNLANYLERQVELRRKVISSLFYPTIMIALSFVVVLVLFLVVVPQITTIFIKEGAKLPFITQVLLTISNAISNYWLILVAVVLALALMLANSLRDPSSKNKAREFIFRIPLLGDIFLKTDISRLALTLGSLLKGGVTLVNALEIASRVAIHPKIQKNLLEVAEKVKEGKLIAPSLEGEGVYPPLFVSMISVGEQSGELEKMLIKIADFYEKESASKLQTLVSLVEPILIIVIGLIVLLVVFAVITPIVEMISILKV